MKLGTFPNETKRFISSLKEAEFRELVIISLLEQMGYRHVRVTHGSLENGKDIVFQHSTPMDGAYYCAIALKAGRVTGDVYSPSSARTAFNQLQQCLDTAITLLDGSKCHISQAYLITNGDIDEHARRSIAGALQNLAARVKFCDIAWVLEKIAEFCPDLLAQRRGEMPLYLKEVFDSNWFIKHLRILGSSRRVPLYQCYSGGGLELAEMRLLHAGGGVSLDKALSEHPFLLVCGPPGSGKSTLLQRTLLDLVADSKVRPRISVTTLPIFVALRTMSNEALKSRASFVDFLSRTADGLMKDRSTLHGINNVFLMLDGIDEIATHAARMRFIDMLVGLSEKARLCGLPIAKCVATSRTYAVPTVRGFKTAFLRPFSESDLIHFAERWFSGTPELEARFVRFVTSRRGIRKLGETPLLLALMAIIFERRPNEFTATRSVVYEKAVRILGQDWDTGRDIAVPYSEDEMNAVMTHLAVGMMESSTSALTDKQIVACFAQLADQGVTSASVRTVDDVVLRYERNSLIAKNGAGFLEFSHNSIKEFLVARHYFETRGEAVLVKHVDDKEWWNVIACYFGILRRFEIAEPRLLRAVRLHPLLTLLCIVEADRTSKQTRDDILTEIVVALAAGKVSFDDEAIPLLHYVGEHAMSLVDELLKSRGPIQVGFFVALNDVLCQQTDRESQRQIKKLFEVVIRSGLSQHQAKALAMSYLAGRNPCTADLLTRLYLDTQAAPFEDVDGFVLRNSTKPKRMLCESISVDKAIATKVAELSALSRETAEQYKRLDASKRELGGLEAQPIGPERMSQTVRKQMLALQQRVDDQEREMIALTGRTSSLSAELDAMVFGHKSTAIGVTIGINFLCSGHVPAQSVRKMLQRVSTDFHPRCANEVFKAIRDSLEQTVRWLRRSLNKPILRTPAGLSSVFRQLPSGISASLAITDARSGAQALKEYESALEDVRNKMSDWNRREGRRTSRTRTRDQRVREERQDARQG